MYEPLVCHSLDRMVDQQKSSDYPLIVDSSSDGTRWLILNRPSRLNAFDRTLQELARTAVDDAADDPATRAVVLTGTGKAFCAGADLDLTGVGPDDRLAPRTEDELRMRYNPTIKAIRTMGKPVIAAVNGTAVGVGCALAMACDHVIAADDATFSLAFSRVGLTLDAGASALLGARVGFGRATRMAMRAERVDAATALDWGMIDEVVPADDLHGRTQSVAAELASGPTLAFAATKRALNAAMLPHLDAVFEVEVRGQTGLVDSVDFREGAAAFAQRRPARFRGR